MPLRRYLDAIRHLDVHNEKDGETLLSFFSFFFRSKNSIIAVASTTNRVFSINLAFVFFLM